VTFITDFADQAVVLPLALAVGIALLAQGWRRGAAAWALTVAATLAMTLVLKLLFVACADSLGTADLHSPSGHVAGATVVAGGLAALLLRRPAVALAFAASAALVIGYSRLALAQHSLPETVLGATVGLVGTGALLVLAGRPPPGIESRRILMTAAAIALLFHGLHMPAEAHIRGAAYHFAQMFAVCQSSVPRL
jgi:membrane-associated phospholipid phosphatase